MPISPFSFPEHGRYGSRGHEGRNEETPHGHSTNRLRLRPQLTPRIERIQPVQLPIPGLGARR